MVVKFSLVSTLTPYYEIKSVLFVVAHPRGQERLRRMKETLGHLDLDTCSLESYDLVTGQHTLTRDLYEV